LTLTSGGGAVQVWEETVQLLLPLLLLLGWHGWQGHGLTHVLLLRRLLLL
jgi:hypothetical protein